LNYSNYKAFLEDQPTGVKTKNIFGLKYKVVVISIVILIIVFLVIHYFTKQRWMLWNGYHYIEVKFDENMQQTGGLKLYKEDRIKNFKQVTPDCDYSFFN